MLVVEPAWWLLLQEWPPPPSGQGAARNSSNFRQSAEAMNEWSQANRPLVQGSHPCLSPCTLLQQGPFQLDAELHSLRCQAPAAKGGLRPP